jgi:ribosomal protein S18 acetylase RimI-like enzyme
MQSSHQAEVVRVRDLSDLDEPQSLFELVDQISASPPYSYAPGEISPTEVWFPALLRKAELTVVAVRDSRVLGYCVALPFDDYGKLGDYARSLGIDASTTMYVAELGVEPSQRRQGIAGRLLGEVHENLRPETTTCVVRTLAVNEPAIELYRRHGYAVVPGLTQEWNGRERVFLTRHL